MDYLLATHDDLFTYSSANCAMRPKGVSNHKHPLWSISALRASIQCFSLKRAHTACCADTLWTRNETFHSETSVLWFCKQPIKGILKDNRWHLQISESPKTSSYSLLKHQKPMLTFVASHFSKDKVAWRIAKLSLSSGNNWMKKCFVRCLYFKISFRCQSKRDPDSKSTSSHHVEAEHPSQPRPLPFYIDPRDSQ